MTGSAALDTSWLGLEELVCVVTGAGSGIGAEIARQLAAAGARVALLDRDAAAAATVAGEIERARGGGRAISASCDVSDERQVAAAADLVSKTLGPCAVLVNNAAAIYADALLDVKIEKWNQLLSVNLGGALLCAQSFARQMITRGGGSIVNVASISGTHPQPYSGAYSVSKAGMKMMSRLLAVELGEHGIRSNVVSPAIVRTPMSEAMYQDPDILRRRTEVVPVRRISGPPDIAQAVLFLASDKSSYVSGQDLLVDGGLSQAWMSLIPRPGFEKKDARTS